MVIGRPANAGRIPMGVPFLISICLAINLHTNTHKLNLREAEISSGVPARIPSSDLGTRACWVGWPRSERGVFSNLGTSI